MTRVYRELLMEMGKAAAEAIAAGMPREETLQMLCSEAQKFGEPEGMARLGPSFGLAWAESGFATVDVAHRLAASLIATSIPQDHLTELVRMPWRCFAFHIPAGLLSDEAKFALVLRARDGRYNMLSFGQELMHCGVEESLENWNLKFLDRDTGDVVFDTPHGADTELWKRESEVLGRLFLGVCAEMSAHRAAIASGQRLRTKLHRHRERIVPHTFKLTRDVKVDVRAAVRDYVEGRTPHGPTVQALVRGHWKAQMYGKKMAQRKMIHVEPYWRGPEDAPAAVRVHRMERSSQPRAVQDVVAEPQSALQSH